MSFQNRFRDNIDSLGRRNQLVVSHPIDKVLKPSQMHRDTQPSPLQSSGAAVIGIHTSMRQDSSMQMDYSNVYSFKPESDLDTSQLQSSWSKYVQGSQDQLHSSKQRRRRTPNRRYDEDAPVQLIASHSLSSDVPVDFSCLDSTPLIHKSKAMNQGIGGTPSMRKSMDAPVSYVQRLGKYVPYRLGGLGAVRVGSDDWARAVSQERRRKEYGNLLRVSWQLKSQPNQSPTPVLRRNHSRHIRSLSDDYQ